MHEITVLAVDDHEAGRYALARLLEQARFVVKQAGTGTECLRLLAEDAPDVVLLDINLPDMNGYEVCRRIKADPRTHDTPVIHVTASARTSQDHARSLEGGADGYVLEPYDPDVLIATIRAVLRAREAEKAAQESALQWQTTFDALGDGVALLDGAGRILRCNKAFCRLLGLPAAELLNRRTPDIWISMGAKNDRYPFLEALASGARETADVQVNGRFLHASCDLISQDSCTTGAVYQISDVTEKRRLEEQVRETQKLESIGVLAGGIAHDFNNLLTGILGNASLALTAMPPDSDLAQNLSEIVSSSERAAELTRQLLAYSGKGRYVLKAVDLSRLVHDMTELLHSSLSKKVDLELALARGLPAVEADVRQLQQVVLNLAVNASEAFGENPGVILIETGVRDGQVSLRISDNGPGMDDRTKSKIFDPFFTTKFLGRGLGLAAVSGIVRSHGGSIEVTRRARVAHLPCFSRRLHPSARPKNAFPQPRPAVWCWW